jgi:DNA adenine methylase/adenine-specific DNA-methyltransferase
MGSKYRLLPWIYDVLSEFEFDRALDAFAGSGCVSYLLKTMGKSVWVNDFLNFSATIARATIENPGEVLTTDDIETLLSYNPRHRHFIEQTFSNIFFTAKDLRFLDRTWGNLERLATPYKRALAISALIRSCAKRQPRGVFTVAGDPDRYKDGRRDVRLSLNEHFLEHVAAYNDCSFDNGRDNRVTRGDIFELQPHGVDLVYMDPPYVPRSDDNCYIKRYHFLEGLSTYWQGEEILQNSRVKKLKKRFTPFSYRKTAIEAFDALFAKFSDSIQVLSYSSNAYPDLDVLISLMEKYKDNVEVFEKDHRYHFGTHTTAARNQVTEYLIVGS